MQSFETAALTAEHRADCALLLGAALRPAARRRAPPARDRGLRRPRAGHRRGRDPRRPESSRTWPATCTTASGRSASAGCAAIVPEAIRDCFAALAAGWDVSAVLGRGPAFEHDLIDAWFRLGFGCQFVWAVRRPSSSSRSTSAGRSGRHARRPRRRGGVRQDPLGPAGAVAELLGARDPVARRVPRRVERPLGLIPTSTATSSRNCDGRAVGHAMLYRRPTGDLRVPEANLDLSARRDARRGPRHRASAPPWPRMR